MDQEQLVEILSSEISQEMAQQLAMQMRPRIVEEWIVPDAAVLHTVLSLYPHTTAQQQAHYAVLLANIMNPKRAKKFHPAFTWIVPQLTEEEYSLLSTMKTREIAVMDCVMCRIQKSGGSFLQRGSESTVAVVRELISRLTAYVPHEGDWIDLQICFDNLLRLGLIGLHMDDRVVDPAVVEEVYEDIYLTHETTIQQIWSQVQREKNTVLRLRRGKFFLTAMGRRFVHFCLE